MTKSCHDPITGTDPYGRLMIYYFQGRLALEPSAVMIPHYLGNWEEAGDTFLFFSEPADRLVNEWAQMNPNARLVDRYEMSYEDWQGGRLEPFSVGSFFIRPPWIEAPVPADTPHALLIDPGVVFGAGTHPTTRDCLKALWHIESSGGAQCAVDLGTGTGILAVAAARMGCRSVVAVDFNLLAVRTTLSNVRANGLEDRVLPIQGLAQDFVNLPADLVIANIHFDAMMPMLKAFDPGRCRWVVLSGLLRSQVRDVEAILPGLAVEVLQRWEHQETWFTLLAAVRAPAIGQSHPISGAHTWKRSP
jgi:ribosomal protein L11 methyltransferase